MQAEDFHIGQLVQVVDQSNRSNGIASNFDDDYKIRYPKVGVVKGFAFNMQNQPELCVAIEECGFSYLGEGGHRGLYHPSNLAPFNSQDVLDFYKDLT